jgi:hypothetical protein
MADDDQRVVFLTREAAEELLELVDDRPGRADENLLDEVIEAIEEAGDGLPGEAQQAVARGEAVAVGLDPVEARTVTTLLLENTETDPGVLRSIGASIKAKLKAASKKARRKGKKGS